jgi:hypothetical protein
MQNSDSAQWDKDLRNVIKINEAQIQDHLGEMGAFDGRRNAQCHTGCRGGPALRPFMPRKTNRPLRTRLTP